MVIQSMQPRLTPEELAAGKIERIELIERCRSLLPKGAPALITARYGACWECNALVGTGRDGTRAYLGDARTNEELKREREERAAARESLGALDPTLAAAFAERASKPYDFLLSDDDFYIAAHGSDYCQSEGKP